MTSSLSHPRVYFLDFTLGNWVPEGEASLGEKKEVDLYSQESEEFPPTRPLLLGAQPSVGCENRAWPQCGQLGFLRKSMLIPLWASVSAYEMG